MLILALPHLQFLPVFKQFDIGLSDNFLLFSNNWVCIMFLCCLERNFSGGCYWYFGFILFWFAPIYAENVCLLHAFFYVINVMLAIWADWWWVLLMNQFLIDDTSKCGIWTKSFEFVLLLWCWRRLHTQFKEMHCWGIEFWYDCFIKEFIF